MKRILKVEIELDLGELNPYNEQQIFSSVMDAYWHLSSVISAGPSGKPKITIELKE